MKFLTSVTALWSPAISVSKTSVCSPMAPFVSNTFFPWQYPMTPYPDVRLPPFSERELSEYTNSMSLLSSSSAMSSMWVFAHSSFTDSLARFAGMKIFTLSSRSTSNGLQGGLAFGVMRSVSSSIRLLTHVMQVVNLFLGFDLYLLDLLYGGNGGGETGVGFLLWSRFIWHLM